VPLRAPLWIARGYGVFAGRAATVNRVAEVVAGAGLPQRYHMNGCPPRRTLALGNPRIQQVDMVTRAFTTLGVGDADEAVAERVVAALDALVVDGEPIITVFREDQDGPWLLDVLLTETDEAGRARWLAAAQEIVPGLPPFAFDALGERDWVAESQRALHPVRAGRFVVHGSHDRDRLPPSRWRLELDAGRAFGTAHHPSTKGSLMALERLAIARPLGDVMDVGTGSGILAVAADRLGARRVMAGDIDPVAVAVARDNMLRNRLRAPIRPVVAAGPFAVADTVVANILARPLVAMAPQLAASAGRWMILSGLRTRDARRVLAAYRARGFALAVRVSVEDWPTLVLKRLDGGECNRAERARAVAVSRPFRVDWD